MRRFEMRLAHVVSLGLFLPGVLRAQGRTVAEFTERFDRYVRESSIVGASMALVRGGQVVARHDVGFGDLALKQRTDTNTIYQYGSITKTLVAITIMQLRDRGLVSLDDPVTRYIPELRRVHDPYGSPDSITVRMLMSHSAGFQNPTWPWKQGAPWEPFEPTTWEQLVAMLPYQQLRFKPGTQWSYSNPALIYLARIVELVTGEPWLVYVQKNVFTPLGMTRSYFSTTPYHLAQYRSNNYTIHRDSATARVDTIANGRDFDPGITNPNGGWNAPLGDMVKWLAFLTGAPSNETLLKRSSLNEMFVPVMPTTASTAERPESIGLTFFILPRNGVTFVGHTGSQNGFTAFMFFNPRTRSAIIAAFNTDNELARPGAFKELYEASLELLR